MAQHLIVLYFYLQFIFPKDRCSNSHKRLGATEDLSLCIDSRGISKWNPCPQHENIKQSGTNGERESQGGFKEQLLHFCVAFLIQTGQRAISSWLALKRPRRAAKQSFGGPFMALNHPATGRTTNTGCENLGFGPWVVIRSQGPPAARFGH